MCFRSNLLQVPLGTIIRDLEGKELSSLEGEREYYIVARGGSGGKGNQYFASSEDTTPRYAEEGAPGEDRVLYLELKIMAHAGLVTVNLCTSILDIDFFQI